MEFIIPIVVLVAFFSCYMILVSVGIRFLRALFRLPQKRRDSGWTRHEDFLFGKPLNRYERRERKGRLRE